MPKAADPFAFDPGEGPVVTPKEEAPPARVLMVNRTARPGWVRMLVLEDQVAAFREKGYVTEAEHLEAMKVANAPKVP